MLKKKGSNKRKVESMFSKKQLALLGSEYKELSSQIKELEEKKKKLSEQIKQGAEALGVKDDNGSFYLDTPDLILGKIAINKVSYDIEKAVSYLKASKLNKCVNRTVTWTLNEKAIEDAIAEGKLDIKELDEFVNLNTSYKVSVVEKEDLPEIEQNTLKSAKRK